MSLYYDATTVLSSPTAGGSLKSRIYNSSLKLKSSPPQIYALIIESSKWDVVIADVIEKAGLLSMEHKVSLARFAFSGRTQWRINEIAADD